MRSMRSTRGVRAALSVGGAALFLSACGAAAYGGTSSPSTAPASNSAQSAPLTPGAPSASALPAVIDVMTASNTRLGTILVDRAGMTLYTLTSNGRTVSCTGSCLSVWTPLPSATGANPVGGTGVGSLGTVMRPDGSQQVTVNGIPVYTFKGDAAPGDAKGQGIRSFGGVWLVVEATSVSRSAPGSGSVTPSPSTTDGGYGY
jgi:predicted lipoprotein with Yx(FWY)xxD motif